MPNIEGAAGVSPKDVFGGLDVGDLFRGLGFDAVLGATRPVPTLEGRATVTILAGTQPETVLRLHGKGWPAFGSTAGDLYVVAGG